MSAPRDMILSLDDPISQRYAFMRYVLGEPRMDAAAVAGALQNIGPMDEREYDFVKAEWALERRAANPADGAA